MVDDITIMIVFLNVGKTVEQNGVVPAVKQF
jgi:hypothetical protein